MKRSINFFNGGIMRAVICTEYGAANRLRVGAFHKPTPSPQDVLIKVHAAAVNFPDNLIIQGEYQVRPPMPFVPGFEVAGEVVEVGEEVTTLKPGDRVMSLTRDGYGGFAELALARAELSIPIPEEMDYVSASGFYSSYGTSFYALARRAHVQAGETVVVLGASGGVGLASIQIAKALGAKVIAVASSAAKLETAKTQGADHLINYLTENLRDRVLEVTNGRGADVCMDTVGGEAFSCMMRSMAHEGKILVVGFASGTIPEIAANLILLKNIAVIGIFWWPTLEKDPAQHRQNFCDLIAMYKEGILKPLISSRYPLAQTPEALTAVLSRGLVGKIVVEPQA